MKWYSLDGKKQLGPISEDVFKALVQADEITAETLVWEEGMTDWLPYREFHHAIAPEAKDITPAGQTAM